MGISGGSFAAAAVIILLIIIAAILITLYYAYYSTYSVPKYEPQDAYGLITEKKYGDQVAMINDMLDKVLALKYEDVFVQSEDGLRLYGKYYHVKDGAPVEIQFHGYRSIAERDFGGGLRLALECGHNVILVDQRAHGRSQGKALTFGVLERKDAAFWVDYACRRFGADCSIILVGISMGAATVLMTGGLPLPGNVKGIIADCGYTSPADIIKKVAVDRNLPVKLSYLLIRYGGMLFGGFDVEDDSAEEALKRCRIPVLFIHGDEDSFVPCDMSRRNYQACAGRKELEIFSGAEHGMSYLADTERYRKIVIDFCESVLG